MLVTDHSATPWKGSHHANLQTIPAIMAQNGADIAMAFAIPSTGRGGA